MTSATAPTGLGLVRGATDRIVLESLVDAGRQTRAEIAQATGVSKPTVSEAVRRLGELGVVAEAGRQEGTRGRSGIYYELAAGAGLAVALHAGPHLVVGESRDVRGGLVRRVERPVGLTVTADELLGELAGALSALTASDGTRGASSVAATTVSVADPVEHRSGRLVHVPGSPFVRGEACLRDVVGGAAEIDNDVHWAAVAELHQGQTDTFLQLYLGAGIGAALVADGRLVRGARGLAGEAAYAVTAAGRTGRRSSPRLLDVLVEEGLTVDGGTVVDVAAVAALMRRGAAQGTAARVVGAVGDVLCSAIALVDPGRVVLSGPWGCEPRLVDALRTHLAEAAVLPVEVVTSVTGTQAPLDGARQRSVELARAALLSRVP
ncbi:ROK family protein [Arsenicicoccus cauae]|uniref:ROK family transcriptional regulator n=1 Tax=Arsenicicoccus cauae TaxID=2663847 RepID=UPI00370D7C5B